MCRYIYHFRKWCAFKLFRCIEGGWFNLVYDNYEYTHYCTRIHFFVCVMLYENIFLITCNINFCNILFIHKFREKNDMWSYFGSIDSSNHILLQLVILKSHLPFLTITLMSTSVIDGCYQSICNKAGYIKMNVKVFRRRCLKDWSIKKINTAFTHQLHTFGVNEYQVKFTSNIQMLELQTFIGVNGDGFKGEFAVSKRIVLPPLPELFLG